MRRRTIYGWLLGAVAASALTAAVLIRVRPDAAYNRVVHVGDQVFRVRYALTAAEQFRGLRGVQGLAPDQGMLFVFEKTEMQTFTMDGMRIGLDLVWIADSRVIGFSPQAEPVPLGASSRYASPASVDMVLELSGGSVERLGLAAGDAVRLEALKQRGS